MTEYAISKEMQEDFYKHTGSELAYENRGNGKTTAIILNTIATAIETPGSPITITDHHNYKNNIIRFVIPELKRILDSLKLKGFIVNIPARTLTFNLYEPKPLMPKRLLKREEWYGGN